MGGPVKVVKGSRVLVARIVPLPIIETPEGKQYPAELQLFEATVVRIMGALPTSTTADYFVVRKLDGTELEVRPKDIKAVIVDPDAN